MSSLTIEFSRDVRPSMALLLEPNKGQDGEEHFTPDALAALLQGGEAWAVRLDGKLVSLGGHVPAWNGRTVLWGCIGADAGPALPRMTTAIRREVKRLLLEFDRIEAYAPVNHTNGKRWLRALGLSCEGRMRMFAHGRDYLMYSRVRAD